MPWLVWFKGLSAGLRTKGSPVRFLVRAQAGVAGRGHVRDDKLIDVSLAHHCFSPPLLPSLPLSLKINK